jgi:signal transduction histidine kinase
MKKARNRKGRLMIPRSIRWRLPLSYAGIALLAVLALGGVLLTTLRNYYDQRERSYLENNARVVGSIIEQMYRDEIPESAIQATVNISSFVSASRVRLLDVEHEILADSGTSPGRELLMLSFAELRSEGAGRVFRPFISIYRDGPPPGEPADDGSPLWGESDGPPPDAPARDDSAPPGSDQGDLEAIFREQSYSLWAEGDPFGYYRLNPEEPENSVRSAQQVIMPLFGAQGSLLGYIELSEGPAFGTKVVADVTQGLLGAGVMAVLLAVVAGWLASRSISQPVMALTHVTRRMAQGQLSARVDLARQDELGSLASSFNTMADRIENTVVTLQRFVADAAHELNTPITALRTNLELATSEDDTHGYQSDLEQAQVELARLERLTTSLLALARLEARGNEVERRPIDVGALVRQMHERYASRAEQGEIALEMSAPAQPVMIQANEEQLTRMLDNLLDNALKFTPSGGTVSLSLRSDEQAVHLLVQDTGIGIPPDDLPKLFSRFHRGRNTAVYPGNGLGLVIVKAIVEEHRGDVTVESSPAGTCFSVRLPHRIRQEGNGHDAAPPRLVDRG